MLPDAVEYDGNVTWETDGQNYESRNTRRNRGTNVCGALAVIDKRRTELFGHVVSHKDFVKNTLEGKIMFEKVRGRSRGKTIEDVTQIVDCRGYEEIKNP